MKSFMVCTDHKKNEIGGACSTLGESCKKGYARRTEGKRSLGRSRK